MKLSRRGAKLIEGFEGFRSCPYRDAVGVWTIGYGSTKGVNSNTKCISQQDAEDRMMREIDATYGAAVNKIAGLNQNQHDALVSFVYNVGTGGIAPTTGIGKALRAKDWKRAADELLKWDKAGGRPLAGLTRRRKAERALFLSKPEKSGYTDAERRWMREYDQLLKAGKDKDRRRVLRRSMTDQRKRIWRAAQTSGWDKADRRARYKSLLARTT
jgi:lysozyme